MKVYYCRGERYSDRVRQGLCGGFGVIEDFIQWLYGRKNIEYFSGWKDKEIIDYMKKTLEKILTNIMVSQDVGVLKRS
jgi:hypothetical protein|nr:MAG TPA: F-box/WD repeat protein [Caudoviricetes sp.]